MAKLINQVHENRVFEDTTVYVSGHAYVNCKFYRCTMIVREGPRYMVGCEWECCVWHLDLLVHDHREWEDFLKIVAPVINASLPRAFEPGSLGAPSLPTSVSPAEGDNAE